MKKLPSRTTSALADQDTERRSALKRLAQASFKSARRNDLRPSLRLEEREIATLKAPMRNVRKVSGAHVTRVAKSIESLGFSNPILIAADGMIIDGVIRHNAAQMVGLTSIPCVVTEALSDTELKLLRQAVNRLGEKGDWCLETLKIEFEELLLEDVTIEVTGFDPSEIDAVLGGTIDVVEPGSIDAAAGPAVSRNGDIFILGAHKLICGDVLDSDVLASLMEAEEARFIFTDEPYNVPIAGHVSRGDHREFKMASGEMTDEEFKVFNEKWIVLAVAHLCDGGIFATFIDWRGQGSVMRATAAAGLTQINLIVWTKTNAGMGSLYRSQHELLPLYKKGSAPNVNNVNLGQKGRWRSNVWTYAGASSLGSEARKGLQLHPTVKPVAMLADALRDLTNRGDIVLDPFLGSGSTLIAAEQTGRICRGIEIDPSFVDVVVKRFEEVTGKRAVLQATGETFSELQTRRAREASLLPQITGVSDRQVTTRVRVRK